MTFHPVRSALLALAAAACIASAGCVAFDGAVEAVHAASGAQPSWLALDLDPRGLAYVQRRVNGVETPMLVDTGAGATMIDLAFARRLGVDLRGAATVLGVGGATAACYAPDVMIEIGPSRFGPLTAVVVDLAPFAASVGRELPVLLGHEIFESSIVVLDYPRKRIAFQDARRAVEDPGAVVLELSELVDARYSIEVRVEGRPPARVQLDTGSSDTLTLFAHYARSANLLAGRSRVTTCTTSGLGGIGVARLATLDALAIGEIALHSVPATIDRAERGALAVRDLDGILGAGILRRFCVTIDARHRRLLLAPDVGWDRQFEKDLLGLQVVLLDGAMEILHVASGSPAEAAGWRAGERITAVDGRDVGKYGWFAWREVVGAPSGTAFALRDGEGRERKVTLAEYY